METFSKSIQSVNPFFARVFTVYGTAKRNGSTVYILVNRNGLATVISGIEQRANDGALTGVKSYTPFVKQFTSEQLEKAGLDVAALIAAKFKLSDVALATEEEGNNAAKAKFQAFEKRAQLDNENAAAFLQSNADGKDGVKQKQHELKHLSGAIGKQFAEADKTARMEADKARRESLALLVEVAKKAGTPVLPAAPAPAPAKGARK